MHEAPSFDPVQLLQVLFPSAPCSRSMSQLPFHWHKQRSAKTLQDVRWWNQHFWAMKCHIKENQTPYFSLWFLPHHVLNPPVEYHLWKNKHECPLGDLSHCTDTTFRRSCISHPHSQTIKKQDLETPEVNPYRLYRNSNRQAKHSDYNLLTHIIIWLALSAISNTKNQNTFLLIC